MLTNIPELSISGSTIQGHRSSGTHQIRPTSRKGFSQHHSSVILSYVSLVVSFSTVTKCL